MEVYIPPLKQLQGRILPIPFFIVADDAFPLKINIMKPCPQRGLTTKQIIYNYRQSRARMYVECAFGILSSRFQIFRKPMAFLLDKVDLLTMTCYTLHNLLISDINEAEALNVNSSAMNRLQHMWSVQR